MTNNIAFHDKRRDAQAFDELVRNFDTAGDTAFIFLGAGFSHAATAHYWPSSPVTWDPRWPLWRQLIERMGKAIAGFSSDLDNVDDFVRDYSSIDVAQLLKTDDIREYDRILHEAFHIEETDLPDPLPPAHRSLISLKMRTLITSNYDQLIEFCHNRLCGYWPNIAFTAETLRDIDPRSKNMTLVKMHGCISQIPTIVLAREDYARSWADKCRVFDFIHDRLAQTTCLFLGYSLTDPNFNAIYDRVRYVTGFRRATMSYVVIAAGKTPVTGLVRRYWRNRGIHIIALREWPDLHEFMTEFCSRLGRTSM